MTMADDVKVVEVAPARSGGSWFKRALVSLLVLGLAAGGAYGAAWYPAKLQREELEKTLAAERARSVFLEDQVKAMDAKLGIHLAIVDLTQQNYGLAKNRIARSIELLSAAPEASLRTLADKLAQIKVEPGQAQLAIDALLLLSAGLDAPQPTLAPSAPPAALPAPAPSTTN
jgi:hypothetical protein